jgi:hypothetical protein
MKVEVVRRGGLVAVAVRGVVDTSDLPARLARDAESALLKLGVGGEASPPRHPDSFRYELAIEVDGERRAAVLDEADLPPALKPVIEAAAQAGTIEPA